MARAVYLIALPVFASTQSFEFDLRIIGDHCQKLYRLKPKKS